MSKAPPTGAGPDDRDTAVFTVAMAERYFGADNTAFPGVGDGSIPARPQRTCSNAETEGSISTGQAEAWFRRVAVRFGIPYADVREAALGADNLPVVVPAPR